MANDTSSSAASLTTLAFRRLRADIISGDLRPGERLRIQVLVERYGIGATAIRESLSRLSSDGLVEFQEQRGFCVAPVSREELLDLTKTRIALEGMALRLAMENGSLEWESKVVSNFHRLSKTPLPTSPELFAEWFGAHSVFHESLLEGCESPTLLHLCRLLREKLARYHNLSVRNTTIENRDAMTEHKKLMEAVVARDAEMGQRLVAEHFSKSAQLVLVEFDKAFPSKAGKPGTRAEVAG
ncbi:GntR family transcriptional regulator [Pandoraea pulmonicola]|uniref:Carbon starvation induced regulator n=1 Tax=Pandoraea pulmonicola TaxID=93221 RepID=A0AAJ4ZGF4_PANPU|nr:FCD domain-containing protein [Pandoraea pulmonicola]APD13570.1 GntR family transcriptional regulator [Pandoraea pulmonicola]SUA92776.1 Carbon starvation induced regulator [Pandoraea pulmonicola]